MITIIIIIIIIIIITTKKSARPAVTTVHGAPGVTRDSGPHAKVAKNVANSKRRIRQVML